MNRFLTIPLMALAVIALTACAAPPQGVDAKNLVPADANFIGQVQVQRILEDPDFENFYRQAPKSQDDPQDFEQLMAKAEEEVGVDFRQFKQAVLFGDVSREEEYFGVIASGKVDEDRTIEAINVNTGANMMPLDFQSVQMYEDYGVDDGTAIVFLDDETTVFGSKAAVQSVISVHQGSMAGISGPVYDTYVELGEPLFSMAVVIPPEAMSELEESFGGGQGFGMVPAVDAIKDIQVVGFLADKLESDVRIEAKIGFVDASSATEMGNTLDGLLKLASGFIEDESTRALLSKVQLNVTGQTITVSLQAPMAEWQQVARSMEPEIGSVY